MSIAQTHHQSNRTGATHQISSVKAKNAGLYPNPINLGTPCRVGKAVYLAHADTRRGQKTPPYDVLNACNNAIQVEACVTIKTFPLS